MLPTDLKPVTDPLVDGLKELVEGGPVPLVKAIQGEPQKLLDQVKHFEPASLVGDELSEPWQALLVDLDDFRPSELLEPVHEQLDALKERLKASSIRPTCSSRSSSRSATCSTLRQPQARTRS